MKIVPLADALYLILERRNQPMHVGALLLIRLPPGKPQFVDDILQRAWASPVSPPFDQRLVRRWGLWFWQRHPSFDIKRHVRRIQTPQSPGERSSLFETLSELHGQPMDRSKPLWEHYIIDGMEGGYAALYFKMHHAMADGVSGMRMLEEAMSHAADDEEAPFVWSVPPAGTGTPSVGSEATRASAWAALRAGFRSFRRVLGTAIRAAFSRNPHHVALFQAPRTMFNQRIGESRRFLARTIDLDRVKAVAAAKGATMNDAVLSLCGSTLRNYLEECEALPDKPLIAMVPVSLRSKSGGGNQVTILLANLATHVADPMERMNAVIGSVTAAKSLFRGLSPTEIAAMGTVRHAPSLLNLSTGLMPTRQSFNVIISNLPGPGHPLHFQGAQVVHNYPVSIVLDGQALNITFQSYADKLEFGVIACPTAVPHLEVLMEGVELGLAELESALGLAGRTEPVPV